MREILFRGKGTGEDKDNWHFGNYLSWQDTTYCFKEDYDKHPENTKHYIVWDEMTDWCLPNKHFKADININTLGPPLTAMPVAEMSKYDFERVM